MTESRKMTEVFPLGSVSKGGRNMIILVPICAVLALAFGTVLANVMTLSPEARELLKVMI